MEQAENRIASNGNVRAGKPNQNPIVSAEILPQASAQARMNGRISSQKPNHTNHRSRRSILELFFLIRSNIVLLPVSVKTIKDVDEQTWQMLKEMAKTRKQKMGSLLREIASEYRKKPSDSWKKILNAKPSLTPKEAEIMLAVVAKIRKEYGYRDVNHT